MRSPNAPFDLTLSFREAHSFFGGGQSVRYIYLRQGGYVFASVSLFVCVCVCHQHYA